DRGDRGVDRFPAYAVCHRQVDCEVPWFLKGPTHDLSGRVRLSVAVEVPCVSGVQDHTVLPGIREVRRSTPIEADDRAFIHSEREVVPDATHSAVRLDVRDVDSVVEVDIAVRIGYVLG